MTDISCLLLLFLINWLSERSDKIGAQKGYLGKYTSNVSFKIVFKLAQNVLKEKKKTNKLNVDGIEWDFGIRRENKSPRPGLRAFYRSISIENEHNTIKSLKTDSKILEYHLKSVLLYNLCC